MKKIIDYRIVDAYAASALIVLVMQLIVEGWQPLGGAFAQPHMTEWYTQTMVKYES
jgi:hypothetical protein